MNKATCNFVLTKGTKKGEICGNPCESVEGECKCHKHKLSYLLQHKEHQKEKFGYLTNNMKISELERMQQETSAKCEQQGNQIGMLIEDLSGSKEQTASLRIDLTQIKEELQKYIEKGYEQNKIINDLRNELSECKRLYENALKEKNEIYREKVNSEIKIQLTINEAIAEEQKKYEAEIEEMNKEFRQHVEKMKSETEQREEKAEKEFDRKLIKLTNAFKNSFEYVNKKLNDVITQCNEFFAKSTKKLTNSQITNQIKKNTSDIEKIARFIGEHTKKICEFGQDNDRKSMCMPQ